MTGTASSRRALGLAPGEAALVIAAHPDDETLGCGGTLARLADEGVRVYVLVVTVRAAAQWGGDSQPATRLQEFKAACAALGVTAGAIAWPDETGDLDISVRPRELVTLIERNDGISVSAVAPAALFLPAASGFHQDHQAVHRAAFAAARAHAASLKPTPRIVLGFRGVEDAWTAHDEPWRVHIDTSRYWTAKEAALRCYPSQLRADGHPRCIGHIHAADAAAGGALGWRYAETFVPYRLAY
jgi:LmbE family N-acetylglucosaminyl deacetylase